MTQASLGGSAARFLLCGFMLCGFGLCGFGPAGRAATLLVGPGQPLRNPSDAAAVARDGDIVVIAPGRYFDCAVWKADDLVVQAAGVPATGVSATGPGVVLTDRACEGKASFVVRGDRVTLRGLTFTRIRVEDRNGAGIRAEGSGLVLERDRFVDDQVGLLIADRAAASVVVRDCVFEANGVAGLTGAADIRAGRVGLLQVEHSEFRDGKGGPSISSAAQRTELSGNRIEAGPGDSQVVFVVGVSDGGSLAMQDDGIALAGLPPRLGAVLVTPAGGEADGEAGGEAGGVTLRRVALDNRTGAAAVLLRDWSGASLVLADNAVAPGDVEATSDGAALYRLKQAAHRSISWLRRAAAVLRRLP